MAIPIPVPLVEFILLGPLDDRRQLQDSPILGDVWIKFGMNPADAQELLISPYRGQQSGTVAKQIDDDLGKDVSADIAFLQGLVIASLTFRQVLEVLVPKTKWWIDKWRKTEDVAAINTDKDGENEGSQKDPTWYHELEKYADVDKVKTVLDNILASAKEHFNPDQKTDVKTDDDQIRQTPSPYQRFVALTGITLWAGLHERTTEKVPQTPAEQISYILENATETEITGPVVELVKKMIANRESTPLIWQVSLNRHAMPAISKSIPAVKADAANTLFNVNCSEIGWAVIDSGIDGSHPAFQKKDGTGSRVKRSFDFKNFRQIVSLSNLKDGVRKNNVALLMKDEKIFLSPPKDPDSDLLRLAQDAKRGMVHWDLVEPFVEIKPGTRPPTNHGTHVAGIIGASKDAAKAGTGAGDNDDFADGMCPDIALFDFRVLGPKIRDTEFAIIAALQFIRFLNDRDNFLTIHGANLSLSIPHDVRNFACGRTPICNECERLVESGVVVVAAAGNHGYKSFETKEGSYESYAAFSITDPGNADSVLTVGATHRFWPHTYGVSFFSSRGPTGDGRTKPDLVAPGERIRAPLLDSRWGDLDGTSMAAPHVSGAAAMLMARYSELIGQPRRIKQILCESATDLGRERSFQGHGMLDVLRAFQSI